ncbi:hypothetical protein [Paenibacillus xylanexedens]|uniref:hypothetical protein n=1 Tax=Paenibacillus xylanexedens TaxID=528191 RepID=UPI000F5238E7|nr:hypothetical protein [Paenibacillus xylanexedens]RPK29839.1 hypothetical protein EDO6_00463 [Paenibacillus xylanexedens]
MNEVAVGNAVSWRFPGAVSLQSLQHHRKTLEKDFNQGEFDYPELYGMQANTIMRMDWANENKFQYIQVLDDVYTEFMDKAGRL